MGLALGVTFKQEIERIESATEELYGFCDEVIADRKANPRDDFMSQLIATTKAPDGLSDEELRNLTLMLVFAGVDTTRNQLGLGMSVFLQHPKQWRLLAARPELAPRAAEEVMRIRPTITWVTREAVEDFSFDGVPIAKGTTIHLLSSSPAPIRVLAIRKSSTLMPTTSATSASAAACTIAWGILWRVAT